MEITKELETMYKEEYLTNTAKMIEESNPYSILNFEDYIECSESLKSQGVFL